MWSTLWVWLADHVAILAAFLTFALTIIWQAVTKWLAPRPKLIFAIPQDNVFLVPFFPPVTEENLQPARVHQRYNARSIFVQNLGSAVAEEVELVLNWVPQHLEHFPRIPVAKVEDESGRQILTIARLNPKETVTFSMLSMNVDLPNVTYVRCIGSSAKQVLVQNMRVYSRSVTWLTGWLMLAGAAASLFILLQIAIWLWSLTTIGSAVSPSVV